MRTLSSMALFVFLCATGSASNHCADWDLRGTFFQPDQAALAAWVPKEVFDRVVVSVDSVRETDGRYEAEVTLDKKLPQTGGQSKVGVGGNVACFLVLPATGAPMLSLGTKVRLLWGDKTKSFDVRTLKSQLLLVSLDKRKD